MNKPWEKLGISESTYWRRKRKGLSNDSDSSPDSDSKMTVDDSNVTVPKKIVFDGTNGNICGDISRAEMKAALDSGKTSFVPNWYSSGQKNKLSFVDTVTN